MKYLKHILLINIAILLASCVQDTHLKTLVFKVDLNQVEDINNPGVKGQFTSPSWKELIPLTDTNKDSIYEAKVEFTAAQYDIKFKFENNGEYELENQPNRSIKFEYEPETFIYEATYNNPENTTTKIN